jgi:thiamine biosynthesis lipoprotein
MTSTGGRGGPAGPAGPRELTPQRVRILSISLVVLLGLTVWRLGFAPTPERPGPVEFAGEAWGTTWSVKLDHELSEARRDQARSTIDRELEFVDTLMSTWREDSELSGLNRALAGEPVALSDETLEMLELSRRVSESTGGAYDVTVGPLVALWGFGADAGAPEPPAPELLAETRARVGYEMLELDRAAGTATRARGDLRVDLSAIAKGYGVDRISEALAELGYPRHLVEVGGELRAGEPKADGTPWRIAVETPDARTRAIYGVLELSGEGVATSGDYRNYYEVEGVRFAHLIDPRTGRPVRHAGASVTVVHPRTAVADAWATALSVLGPEAGYERAEAEGLSAFFIWQEGETFMDRATSPMRELAERTAPVANAKGDTQ